MGEIWEIILDALWDSLRVFPFLFLMYVLIELLERRTAVTRKSNVLRGNLAPLLGAATGIIPQCGFSVMAAKLYDRRLIRTGTLLAVFVATSDEAFVLLLTAGDGAKAFSVMPLVAVLFVAAVGVGYLCNAILRGEKLAELREGESVHGTRCGHDHEEDSALRRYLVHPLLHSLEIFAYILIVNLAFGFAMHYAADAISAARPGARRENLENYIKRLEQLETITGSYPGVEKAYAIQAGREVRVMVKPEQVSEDQMVILARDLAKKIEEEMEYPGQIKVHVIRETKVIEYAK